MKISRRKLSDYVAEQLIARPSSNVLEQLAAYLIENGREREAELIIRDIETKLLDHGIAVADTVSARPLTDEARASVEQMIKSAHKNVQQVHLRETIDESVIGGVKIVLPNARLDGTVKAKLEKLGV